jgi:hypothetical protein
MRRFLGDGKHDANRPNKRGDFCRRTRDARGTPEPEWYQVFDLSSFFCLEATPGIEPG